MSTGLALISTLFAGYRWYKLGVTKPNLITPAILSVIPVIQWFWLVVSIVTILASQDNMKKAQNK